MKYTKVLEEVMKETQTKQKALADAMGIGQPAISNIFNDKSRKGIQLNKMLEMLEFMGYEIVVQKKTQGRRKDGQMVITKEEV